jgi:HEAT repeat protein
LSEKKAEEVIQPLIDQLNVEAPSIRLTAALVLGEVGRGRSEVIAALQKALVDSNEQVREAACWALEKQQRASHRIL